MKIVFAIFSLFSVLTGNLFAQEEQREEKAPVKNQYGYADLGLGPAPIPLPIFGMGYRYQYNHHGFDANVRASTIVAVTAAKLGAHYLHYFDPNLESQFYIGGGLGSGYIGLTSHWSSRHFLWVFTPEMVFGKSYLTDSGSTRFLEVTLDFPVFSIKPWHLKKGNFAHGDVLWFPCVSFHYGWGF